MKVFYFIKYFENGFSTYFDKIKDCIATFTFDLEDSIHDFYDQNNSRLLKEKYREILKKVLCEEAIILKNKSIAVRINNPETKEFLKDIELLSELKDTNWDTIIIPKVENSDQIRITLQELNKNHVNFQNIAIFCETTKGMLALKKIISDQVPELLYVIFGHADLNLDKKIFPFIHQSETTYWKWIEEIFCELKGTKISFINSPCLFLGDNELFYFNLYKLSSIFKESFGQMTLTLNQTIICNRFLTGDYNSMNYPSRKVIDKTKYALDLIKTNDFKKSEKSFSINEEKYLTCPQEVFMARSIIESNWNKE